MIDIRSLGAPFSDADLEWRIQTSGKGGKSGVWALCVPYLTSRAIQQRLDDVCGPANWRNEFVTGPGGGVLCGISIYLPNGVDGLHWVTKWDGAENTDIEAVKGGLSGAMKRAAVHWGMGRHLYGIGDCWAETSLERKHDGWDRAKTKDGTEFWWKPPRLDQKERGPAGDEATPEQTSELVDIGARLGDEATSYVEQLISGPLTYASADKALKQLRKRLQKVAA